MADKDLTVHLKADDKITPAAKKAADALKQLEKPVEVEIDADVSKVLGAFDDLTTEAKQTAEAAEKLGRALGPELAAKADTTAIVQDLKQAGLTIDQITGNADQLAAKLKEVSDADVGGKLGRLAGDGPRADRHDVGLGPRAPTRRWRTWSATPPRTSARWAGWPVRPGWPSASSVSTPPTPRWAARNCRRRCCRWPRSPGRWRRSGSPPPSSSKEMARAAASKAFNAAQLKEFTDSVEDTGSVLKAINDQLDDTGQLIFKIAGGFDAIDVGGDIAPMLASLNLSTAEFLRLVNSGDASWTRFMDGLKAAGVAEQDLINIQVAHGRILADQATATELTALKTELLAEGRQCRRSGTDRTAATLTTPPDVGHDR